MGRFYIEDNKIKDEYKQYATVDLKDNDAILCLLNAVEMDRLEYKRRMSSLKYKIRQLVQ